MRDPYFPNLPLISDDEWDRMSKEERHQLHVIEVEEAAKIFDALQAQGMDMFEAAERTPTPRMNRSGSKQSDIRKQYSGGV